LKPVLGIPHSRKPLNDGFIVLFREFDGDECDSDVSEVGVRSETNDYLAEIGI
jgi:hypothetical protein